MKHSMKLPSSTKAVLFDMDGVIFNTEDLAHNVFSELATRFNKTFNEADHQAIIGTAEQIWTKYFIDLWSLDVSQEGFSTLFWFELKKKISHSATFMPFFEECIAEVRKNGMKTALVTSTPLEDAKDTIAKFNLDHYFDQIITGDLVQNGKPSPEPYLFAAKQLYLEPNQCAVIEDAVSGVISGKAAGCYVVAVPTLHSKGLDYTKADKIIENLHELI